MIGSQQRVDLADFLSIQSYVSSDFRELVRGFVGSNAVILKGFEIINAPQSIGTTSISINVADSVLFDPTATAGSFFSGLPAGNALSQPIVLGQELRPGTTNYVYLTMSTTGAGQDTRAFWDVDLNGGAGGEFNQTINTEAVLVIEAGVSTAGFPQGTIPVAKIGFSSSAITDITDCRNMMFRLGTGGTSPDPNNRFQFPALPSLAYARSEPPSTINSSALPNPFQGGDKNIQTLKEWMDAVMTKLVELSGTTYWYESTGDLSLVKVYDDALASSLKSKGKWTHDETTVGEVTWTEDITYSKMNDPREIIVRAGSKTLSNEQLMWIKMVRNQKINALDTAVTFINGASYINGTVGSFQYLNKGDWIKQKGDSERYYARIVGFYTTPNGTGSETITPSDAVSVKLETAYTGSAGVSSAVYTKGVFTSSDPEGIRISDRDSLDVYNAGGDMYWLATRSDTIQTVSGITITALTGVTIGEADGVSAKITFGSAHGLSNGDRIVVSGGTVFDGTYQVEVVDSTNVTIQTSATGTTSAADVSWAVVTTGARLAAGSTFQIESASHGFASGQKVAIDGVSPTTPENINGQYLVNVRNSTQFQIPYDGASFSPNVANATATCAKVILKTNLGSVEVVQGETININEPDTQNILSFVGMGSLAETSPVYAVPDSSNNMLHGYTDYNSSSLDSLTTRVSRLTAMMADRVQDRGITISGRATIRNTTSGSNQTLTISGDSLTIDKPGSPQQIMNWSSPYVLATNTALVVDIDRNNGGSATTSVVPFTSNFLVQENRLVLLFRTLGTDVFAWDGTKIPNSGAVTLNDGETSQNRNVIVNEQVSVNYDGTKLNFSSAIGYVYLSIPGTSIYNRVDVSNFTSGIAIANNESAWVRVNRWANKTYTNSQTSATYQDTDAAGSVYVTSTSSVPTDQDVFVLYSIDDQGHLVRHHSAPIARRSIYEEFYTVVGGHTAGYSVSLPVDSRNGGATAYYITGSGQLEVQLNGQKQYVGNDYTEVGVSGTAQASVVFQRELVDGDEICFRMASEGGFYTIDIGTTTTLQQAYDQGRTITIVDGSPVVVNSSVGFKALQINGDLGVTGVIDPTGLALTPQASNPLATDHGIWVDTSGNLVQARPGETPSSVNITESITDPSSFLTAGDGIDISVATISVDLSTTPGLEFDTGKLQVLADPAGGLTVGAGGVAVVLEATDPTLQVSGSNELGVKLDPAGAVVTGTGGVAINLETTDPSLEIDTNKLAVKVDPAGAIVKGATGLSVAVDGSTVSIVGNQLVVAGVPNLLSVFDNNSGSSIAAGSIVAGNTTAGQVVLASASSLANAVKTIGVAFATIADGDSGQVQTAGIATVSVSGLTVGQPVYLDPTTPGSVTSTRPTTYGTPIFIVGVAVATNQIALQPKLVAVNTNLYREVYVQSGTLSSGGTITLPTDSRASGATRYYTVGAGYLSVFLNGQLLDPGEDYDEVGTAGTDSNTITISQDLSDGDRVTFRIEAAQAMAKALTGLT